MKRIILPSLLSIALSITATFSISAQTGPGGVGNSSDNILWLDASTLGLSDGDPISTWPDLSGNGNDAFQNDTSFQPTVQTNEINGNNSIKFDGTNDFLEFTSNISTAAISTFIVYNRYTGGGLRGFMNFQKHYLFDRDSRLTTIYSDATRLSADFQGTNQYFISSMHTDSSQSSGNLLLFSSNSERTYTRAGLRNVPKSIIGARAKELDGSVGIFSPIKVSELIVFNHQLGSAKRKIVGEYLAGKYNLTSEAGLFSYKSNFGGDVKGIGQESDGSHNSARGADSLLISNPSSLNNGEYLIVGNNRGGYGTTNTVGSGAVERWNQIWRADKTGTPGTVDLEFFIDGNGFADTSNYVVLIEDQDGDFANGGFIMHEAGRIYNPTTQSIKFTDVSLPDGAYFTLGEKANALTSIGSGNWNDPAIWSCECIPSMDDLVITDDSIIISDNQNVLNIEIQSGGALTFFGTDTLFIHDDFIINGRLYSGEGTIAAVRSGNFIQEFTNNSNQNIELHNLYVNNNLGLHLINGDWSINNSLRVSSGGLDVISANSMTLLSNASKTSEILPSMENAFSGEFTIQRYISNRQANYSNHGAPISDATVADLDDENDIIISGVGGNDGDIKFADSSTFYSMFFYDAQNSAHVNITSTATPLPPANGFELYLLSTPSYFSGATIDYKGAPNNGSYSTTLYWKWNLIGNPFHAHISYDSTEKHRAFLDNYMIFNSTTGTYDLYSGSSKPLIAPGQGFWVHNAADYSNGRPITIDESDKVSSNSSTFKRRKNIDPHFKLNISNNQNPFSHKMRLAFDVFATAEMDENDVTHLPSPIKEAPAIYSMAVNSDEKLIINSLNPSEGSQLIPISIDAGVAGDYEVRADNLDALYNNYSCVYLKDEETEKAVDLMVDSKYSFEAKQGKSDRFHLILSNSYEECQALLKEGEFVQDFDQKLSLRNAYENWYVDYTLGKEVTQLEIRVYNMSGQEVKAPMSFEAHGAGTYPLQHLNDLDGIYLIQVIGKDVFLNKQVKL